MKSKSKNKSIEKYKVKKLKFFRCLNKEMLSQARECVESKQ